MNAVQFIVFVMIVNVVMSLIYNYGADTTQVSQETIKQNIPEELKEEPKNYYKKEEMIGKQSLLDGIFKTFESFLSPIYFITELTKIFGIIIKTIFPVITSITTAKTGFELTAGILLALTQFALNVRAFKLTLDVIRGRA